MKFSVVIPLYNKASFIVPTINSVLAQTMGDFEIIVVDDGSTDGSAELVRGIADSRVRLVHQANAGVSAARNHAISLARGEWIAFLDADDWHHPHYLASLVQVQKAHPNLDTVASDYLPVSHAEGIWPKAWPYVDKHFGIEVITDLPTRWMQGQCLFTSSVAVRTELLQAMQPCFPVGESNGEDLDLWFRLAERSPIALARTPLVAYRTDVMQSLSAGSKSSATEPFLQRLRQRALSGLMTACQSRSTLRLVAQFEVSRARQSLESGCRLDCIKWLLKARHAALSRRWWMTAIMAIVLPAPFAAFWFLWRQQKMTHQAYRNAMPLQPAFVALLASHIPKSTASAPFPVLELSQTYLEQYAERQNATSMASRLTAPTAPFGGYVSRRPAANGLSRVRSRTVYRHQRVKSHTNSPQRQSDLSPA